MSQAVNSKQRHLADLLFPNRADRSEDDDGILSVPLNERRLQTETYDFTISTIFDFLRKDKILVPDFQRRYVWTRALASRLIESLIIQCPIPVVYLDQENDGILKVIDGNQRLMSIRLFLENGFKLTGLKAFPDLNGFFYRELDPRFRSHIENRTIRCITILKDTHPQIKFDVFERLNSGAVQLNPQELRHGLYHGALMDKLDELGEYGPWKELTRIKDDKRMRGAELILRFLALCFRLESYEKPLATFLNNFAQINRQNSSELEVFKETFISTVDIVQQVLDKSAFRLLDDHCLPEKNFNSAIFDAQMVGFAHAKSVKKTISQTQRQEFLRKYLNLQNNKEYNRAISASTSDAPLVQTRVRMFRDLVNKHLV